MVRRPSNLAHVTTPANTMGIDGCRGGWFAVRLKENSYSSALYEHMDDLDGELRSSDLVFIDIPIGLSSSTYQRTIDIEARKLLSGGRKSSIFSPACREALLASDYSAALSIHRKITGKGISIQSWNISPKISDADSWLRNHPLTAERIFEAHPEICFKMLNDGIAMNYSKKTRDGLWERMQLLEKLHPGTFAQCEQAFTRYLRSTVLPDDIVDAFGLALSASLAAAQGIQIVADQIEYDAEGVRVAMAYANGVTA